MSIKMYNGFEFVASKPSKRFTEVLAAADEFRALCRRELDVFILEKAVHHAITLIDKMDYGLIPKKSQLHWEGLQYVRERLQEAYFSASYHPYDYQTSLIVYPLGSKLYGQTFGRNDWINKWWLTRKDVKDFHYQNQCDMPEDVSKKDWNKREKVWETIFDDYNKVPSDAGFIVEIIHPQHNVFDTMLMKDYKELVVNYLTEVTFERRINALAAYIYSEETKKPLWEVLQNKFHLETVNSIKKELLREKLVYEDLTN